MMGQKHLHELLSQDQEPFHLHNYITDRRRQLKTTRPPNHKSHKLLNPTPQASTLFKQACFLSFHNSPDLRKSLLPLPPKRSVCLHIPSKTAALLLEAATKIQKQSPTSKPHTKFGVFGSILKKLKDKNYKHNKKADYTSSNGATVIVKEADTINVDEIIEENNIGFCHNNYCSNTNDHRLSSGDKSCSTSRSDYAEEIDFAFSDKGFCSSPFRFTLIRSPSVGHQTPDFLSPTASPGGQKIEETNTQEEEKDQCSPVSVLDTPFQDYDDEERDGGDEEDDDDSYDRECSYATVQRVKLRLLGKLSRFERLAELEPVELEKRMLEEYDDIDPIEEEDCAEVDESRWLDNEGNADEFVIEVFSRSSVCDMKKISSDMKRLVLDLMTEEKLKAMDKSNETMVNMVCKRLDSWREVEWNTIDMMVELDFRKEGEAWKSYLEEVAATAKEIERAIFGLLVEELVSSYC